MNIYETRQLLRTISIYDIKLKVAFYGRVSTDKEEQKSSIFHQENYYEEFIHSHINWSFAGKYLDEGISGVNVKKREAFLKMIEDARLGKIDLIITKEISRFARNTLDSIRYTRELLGYGTAVWFQNDNINTLDEDAELRLTIMAGVAQDESRKLSSRIRFGHERSIKNGIVMGNSLIYGYKKEKGKLVVDEKEAEMIRMIYEKYASGWTTPKIEELLWERGYRNHKNGRISRTVIGNIIKNPKYKGYYTGNKVKIIDLFQKTQKFLPEEEWIMYKDDGNTVPAIVEEALWEKANCIFKERGNNIKAHRSSYKYENIFTGKLFCESDGSAYWMKQHSVRGKENASWVCSHKIKNGKNSCASFPVKESELKVILCKLIERLSSEKEIIVNVYMEFIQKYYLKTDSKKQKELLLLQEENENLKERQDKILDYNLKGHISDQEFIRRNKMYEEQIGKNTEQIREIQNELDSYEQKEKGKQTLEKILAECEKYSGIKAEELTKEIVAEIIEKIIIESISEAEARMTVVLKNNQKKINLSYYRKREENSEIFFEKKGSSDQMILTI